MKAKEAYCSKEVCKLLREKGFDIEIPTHIDKYGIIYYGSYWNWNQSSRTDSCPTHQMACAWIRDEYNIDMWVEYCIPDDAYVYTILIKDVTDGFTIIHSEDNYPTYEEAVEAALMYTLNNLI